MINRAYLQLFLLSCQPIRAYYDHEEISFYVRKNDLQIRSNEHHVSMIIHRVIPDNLHFQLWKRCNIIRMADHIRRLVSGDKARFEDGELNVELGAVFLPFAVPFIKNNAKFEQT
jgi:hypothetical protein